MNSGHFQPPSQSYSGLDRAAAAQNQYGQPQGQQPGRQPQIIRPTPGVPHAHNIHDPSQARMRAPLRSSTGPMQHITPYSLPLRISSISNPTLNTAGPTSLGTFQYAPAIPPRTFVAPAQAMNEVITPQPASLVLYPNHTPYTNVSHSSSIVQQHPLTATRTGLAHSGTRPDSIITRAPWLATPQATQSTSEKVGGMASTRPAHNATERSYQPDEPNTEGSDCKVTLVYFLHGCNYEKWCRIHGKFGCTSDRYVVELAPTELNCPWEDHQGSCPVGRLFEQWICSNQTRFIHYKRYLEEFQAERRATNLPMGKPSPIVNANMARLSTWLSIFQQFFSTLDNPTIKCISSIATTQRSDILEQIYIGKSLEDLQKTGKLIQDTPRYTMISDLKPKTVLHWLLLPKGDDPSKFRQLPVFAYSDPSLQSYVRGCALEGVSNLINTLAKMFPGKTMEEIRAQIACECHAAPSANYLHIHVRTKPICGQYVDQPCVYNSFQSGLAMDLFSDLFPGKIGSDPRTWDRGTVHKAHNEPLRCWKCGVVWNLEQWGAFKQHLDEEEAKWRAGNW